MREVMRVDETCACGASFSISGEYPRAVADATDRWRATHHHLVVDNGAEMIHKLQILREDITTHRAMVRGLSWGDGTYYAVPLAQVDSKLGALIKELREGEDR